MLTFAWQMFRSDLGRITGWLNDARWDLKVGPKGGTYSMSGKFWIVWRLRVPETIKYQEKMESDFLRKRCKVLIAN